MEKICLICNNAIAEGEETCSCPDCGKVYHVKCWKTAGCCADPECRKKAAEKATAEAAVPQTEAGTKDDKQKTKKRNKLIIVVAVVLVYTTLVSLISIGAYKSYIKKEIEESIAAAFSSDDTVMDSSSGDAEKDNKKKEKVSEKISVGQSVTVDGMFEIKIEKSEWKEDIKPSNTSGRYFPIEEVEGEKYFIVWAEVKNISSVEIDLYNGHDNGKCSAFINGKYNLEGKVETEETDGTGFYGTIKPLQKARVAFYVSVPDEMYDSFETAEVYISLVNNESAIDNFSATEGDYDTFALSFKNS